MLKMELPVKRIIRRLQRRYIDAVKEYMQRVDVKRMVNSKGNSQKKNKNKRGSL